MSFWQENFAFIKDVYDSRAKKMSDLMDAMDISISDILAEKIYTSEEFKKVKNAFASLARNLDQPEVKTWLSETKDSLFADKGGNKAENEKISKLLERFDEMTAKSNDTKLVVDCLWKSYQYTDELAPLMEWIEENISKSTRDINTNSAAQTEELQEKQEKILDQIEKKKKTYMEQKAKGEKILTDPKCPKFLGGHIDMLNAKWKEANNEGENRLKTLKDNMASWDKYERERDGLADKLAAADTELVDTKKVFSLEMGPKDHADRIKTAANMRKDIEGTFAGMVAANETLNKLLEDDVKAELGGQVSDLKARLVVMEDMDAKLKGLVEFNGQLVQFDGQLNVADEDLKVLRGRMDALINPEKAMEAQDRVMATMELQCDVQLKCDEYKAVTDFWEGPLKPTESGENTDEAQGFEGRLLTIQSTQNTLLDEVKAEGAKYGEDVKYLADLTSAFKKFEPWIAQSEAKKGGGMQQPSNLEEALDHLAAAKKWQEEAVSMKQLLAEADEAAKKMTLHDDADAKHAAFVKRWVVIDATSKDWIGKLEKMVEVWKKQAETAAKVSAAIAAKPEGDAPAMKLEDLEKHLDALKKMFIEKQKMMDDLNKEAVAPPAAAPAPAEPAPAAPAPAPEPAAAAAT